MKRALTFCLIISALLLIGCKDKTITSFYSIGCLDFYGEPNSDWAGFEHYMDSLTNYNVVVSFTNKSQELNDSQAMAYFDNEFAKIKEEEVCAFLVPGSYVVYGIGNSADSLHFNIVKAVRIGAEGITPYSEPIITNK
ncbi:MAG: hypothetical protein MJZ57_05805 [Bacteroidales bacterium]|nr:hypothetical protein [Bacteroidales bacterium]